MLFPGPDSVFRRSGGCWLTFVNCVSYVSSFCVLPLFAVAFGLTLHTRTCLTTDFTHVSPLSFFLKPAFSACLLNKIVTVQRGVVITAVQAYFELRLGAEQVKSFAGITSWDYLLFLNGNRHQYILATGPWWANPMTRPMLSICPVLLTGWGPDTVCNTETVIYLF